jgi:TatD DNase family protein
MEERGLNTEELLSRAFNGNLSGAMEVAVDERNFSKRIQLAERFPLLRLSVGIHPSSSGGNDWLNRFDMVVEQANHPLVRAIGETGLDFYRSHASSECQLRSLRAHLELSKRTGLPVILHNREADKELLSIVAEVQPGGGIFHCFSSDWELARQALDLGFHISFSGNISYKNTEAIREAASRVPRDRILVETDAPYLAPQAVRGRLNHPGYIGYTLEALAAIRNEKSEDLAELVNANAKRLFVD